MNADSNQGFAASPRQLGLGEKRIRLLAAAAATDRLVMEERTKTQTRNNKCVLTSVSCVMAVTRLAWRPREHTRDPHVEDDRVQNEGALQPRLVPLRVHEGGVHGPVQELLVEQDAVDVLHCGSTQKTVTVRASEKKPKLIQAGNSLWPFPGIRGLLQDPGCFYRN